MLHVLVVILTLWQNKFEIIQMLYQELSAYLTPTVKVPLLCSWILVHARIPARDGIGVSITVVLARLPE